MEYATKNQDNLVAIGSVINRATSHSTVWGAGSFGTERRTSFNADATYVAVRGPLTRSRLLNLGIDCPAVYGDPALLVPNYYNPPVEKTHEVGIIVRHTETNWQSSKPDSGVKLINFGSSDIENVIRELLACKRIASSSLHGLILADAYGIPNAWLESSTATGGSRPNGGDFKFYDYLISVNKVRPPQIFPILEKTITLDRLMQELQFDERSITFDSTALMDACPLVSRS